MATTGQSDHARVFDWLGVDKQGTPYHLHPLNLSWSLDGVDHDLNVYKRAADQLAADASYWAAIIRDANWRFTLVGCVCLLVKRQAGHFDDLSFRFEAGSLIVPQLAVTMDLLNPERAKPFFQRVLATPELRKHPSRAVSADLALVKLGVRQHPGVAVGGWDGLGKDDAMAAQSLVKQHWAFWSQRM